MLLFLKLCLQCSSSLDYIYLQHFSLQVPHNQLMMYLNQHERKTKVKKPIQNSKSSFEIQVQKPCQPNWEHGKIIALVAAKGEEHMANIKEVDGRHQFETAVNKCKNISKAVMEASYSEHMRNGPAFKDKWHTIASDFKKTYNFMACTGNNQDYWTMRKELLPICLRTLDGGYMT